MSYNQTWLENPSSIRTVLIVATAQRVSDSIEVPFYFSTGGYVTTDGVIFNPVIIGNVGFQETISDDGSVSMSFGDIELHNLNGELDYLLDNTQYIWSNRSIKVYYGDHGWKFALSGINSTNYLLIFDGVIDDVDSRSNRSVNFKVRDKLERLNAPLSENKIGTYGVWPAGQQNKDLSRPIVFGEVFNITPVLINPATLEYCFSSSNPVQVADATQTTSFANNGASEALLEIRDNGVPVYNSGLTGGAVVDLTTSTFKLTNTPAGAITCSVQGVKKSINTTTGALTATYTNSIPNTIAVIVTEFGKVSTKLSVTELDITSFKDFDNTAEIGLLVQGTDNVLGVCQQLASSLGGQLIMSRTGLLRLIRFGVPLSTTIAPTVSIGVNDILYDSLNISRRFGVRAAIKLAYAKNYTIQNNLLSAIPDSHKTSFETEWLTTTASNSNIRTSYKLDLDPVEKQTALISTIDAVAEAARLNSYFDEQRTIYRFTGKPRLLSLVLGQAVTLTHPRFGLSAGKAGQVVSLSTNWIREQVEVEVVV